MIWRVVSLIGMARPTPIPATAGLMPTTSPLAPTSAPPEVPGVGGAAVWDSFIDRATFSAPPRRKCPPQPTHAAGGAAASKPGGFADRHYQLAHFEGGGLTEPGGWRGFAIGSHHRQVRQGV